MFNFLKKLVGLDSGKCTGKSHGKGGDDVESLKAFVEFIAGRLVDYPEKVTVETVDDERVLSLRISCEKSDVGKIVGKHGKTIAAIRSLVSGAGGRLGRKTVVEVLD